MIKIFIILISFIIILSLPIKVLGEETSSSSFFPPIKNLPEPVIDLFQSFSKIKLNINNKNNIPVLQNNTQEFSPEKIRGEIKSFWQKVNIWIQEKLGINLKEIVKFIGNLFILIFEFIIKLIKTGISYL